MAPCCGLPIDAGPVFPQEDGSKLWAVSSGPCFQASPSQLPLSSQEEDVTLREGEADQLWMRDSWSECISAKFMSP